MAKKIEAKDDKGVDHPPGGLQLPEFLCFSIYSANHAFNRVYEPLLKKLNLTYLQFITMVLLWERDGQLVGELGRKLSLQSNTLTPMLKRLEAIGYIKRRRDDSDERQVLITLTASGRQLHLSAADVVRSVRKATDLRDEQFEALKSQVDSLREALEGKHNR